MEWLLDLLQSLYMVLFVSIRDFFTTKDYTMQMNSK